MTQLWRDVFEAADLALDLEPEAQRAFVRHCLAEDPAIGAELKALIDGAARASVLESSASAFAAPFLQEAIRGDPPTIGEEMDGAMPVFGAYRVRRELGSGGMGAVYLAERSDDQYRKDVALKVLPRWSGNDRRRLQRFLDERQILAGFDHPGIARLLDGGVTADGLPWFAMEYIDGEHIDRYCDERRLSIDKRLALFCDVCTSVQYAHRNLVVHRDLKPSNILVAADGRAVLVDFGIARALSQPEAAEAAKTTGARLLTPLYSSPELIRGGPVSTSADVYALGVLLHTLLTGGCPYRLSSLDGYEVARAVLEQEPERPSISATREVTGSSTVQTSPDVRALARGETPAKLARRLRGDLDAIVLTAMAKDPGRRYATVQQLETDVHRYLTGLPVVARPESRRYHAGKFLRRHPMGSAFSAIAVTMLASFAAVMTVQRSRIQAQADKIAVERDRAERIGQSFLNIFRSVAPREHGVAAREILDSAAARVDKELAGQPEQQARMMFGMAQAYHRLGLNDRAGSLLERTLVLRRGLRPGSDRDIAATLHLLGAVHLAQDSVAHADSAHGDAGRLRRQGGSTGREYPGTGQPDAFAAASALLAAIPTRAALVGTPSTSRIVFVTDRDEPDPEGNFGNQEIYVMNADGTDQRRLTNQNGLDYSPALSPDGKRIAFASQRAGGIDLFVMNADGTDQRQLTNLTALGLGAHEPTWSPDSKRIAFNTRVKQIDIWAINADGTRLVKLTNDPAGARSPAWSPDGRKIAYVTRRDGHADIFVMNADGSNPVRLTVNEFGDNHPAWSPDGRRIAFYSNRDGADLEIYVMNADGSEQVRLTNHPGEDSFPCWSPDGRQIVFQRMVLGHAQLHVMNADGSNVRRLTELSPVAFNAYASWGLARR
jgi:serine/threonine-protein kinase